MTDPSTGEPADPAGAALAASQATENGTNAVAGAAVPAAVPAAAITPLAVPWLHHDGFPTVKKVCSESGLPQAKKTSVVRVLQELKKGRSRIDQQLAHLETQLLQVSDFLSGVTPTLEIAMDDADAVGNATAARSAGPDGDALQNGQRDAEGDKSAPIDPMATLVEEDLAAETPCTTTGLWRFLSVFPFFKTVTLEDMQEALLLDDPMLVVPSEATATDATNTAGEFMSAVDSLPLLDDMPMLRANGKGEDASSVHEVLRMRLLAALLPEGSNERMQEEDPHNEHEKQCDSNLKRVENGHASDVKTTEVVGESLCEHIKEDNVKMPPAENGHQPEDDDVKMAEIDESDDNVEMVVVDNKFLPVTSTRATTRTLQQLQDIGLVEATTEEVTQHLTKRQDDEVSSEIRMLQGELLRQVRRNNEVKRTLRRALERLKPWLTHDDEYQQIETKFQKMWHRKKELQRKKKHKEKKLQRKEASYKSAFVMPPQPPVPS